MYPDFTLSVQYAVPAPALPRWRLRRWVGRALAAALAPPDPRAGSPVALTLRIVDAGEGRALNAAWRGRDAATNVLTFEYGADPSGLISGDIVLCLSVLEREAAEQGKPLLHHAAHLVTHGVLHALGHDHIEADEAERMEALETRILAAQDIPDPYAT
ncbi:Metal-dependent hydrolase YbeY [Castellaniella defragrans 65Phen]|uniref:Endoribonuclease YbeY n=3 Tax=Castellaniella defragrans TaxID=75697 RepID=W8X9W9_CASD6|nr:rRNA maturation RNase YbeY [Castellaniella defragrans]MBB6082677.1 putative rRNA maturation factor [Castellaniella defragrans]CDM25555.1 Metal-dependent hydrolase YbeY [Castellaniella defragrans 65Phen]